MSLTNLLHCHHAVIMYVILPMPLIFFAGSDTSSLYTESGSGWGFFLSWFICPFHFNFVFGLIIFWTICDRWVDVTKFLTGASAVGSIAIPIILKHAGVIGWGAMAMELSSFFIFVMSILCFLGMNEDDGYSMLWIWPLFCICTENEKSCLLPFLMIIVSHILLYNF